MPPPTITTSGEVSAIAELTRLATIARRARECLRDSHPRRRDGSLDDEPRIRDVTTARDDTAEVDGASANAIRRRGVAPRPLTAARAGELDTHVVRRRRSPLVREAVTARDHAEVRDVPEAIGVRPRDAERVGDVLAVTPRLLDTRGHERHGAHVGPEPRQTNFRTELSERDHFLRARATPPREHVGARERASARELIRLPLFAWPAREIRAEVVRGAGRV